MIPEDNSGQETEKPLEEEVERLLERVNPPKIDRLIGIQATDRAALIDFAATVLMNQVRTRGLHLAMPGPGPSREQCLGWLNYADEPPFLKVVLPCGSVREWEQPSAVPDFSVPCNCGVLPYEHFFIAYTTPAAPGA